jgi:serine/threonine-protein kinase RsbW
MSPENPEIADINGFEGDEWVIHSDPEERNDAVEAIEQRLKVLEWDEKPMGDFSLAAAEAIANAIIHGNGGDINKKVEISLNLTKDMAEITVRDEGGVLVDPAEIPDPHSEEGLLKTSGRGILLMKELCDEVEFNPGETRILKRNNNGVKK